MSAAGHVLYTSELSGVDPERPDGEADLMVIRDHPMLTNELTTESTHIVMIFSSWTDALRYPERLPLPPLRSPAN